MKVHSPFALLLMCLLITKFSSAQLYEIGLDEKVAGASVIVEGKVTEKKSFWNPAHTMIFTANKVEVYKMFKGSTIVSTLEVLTQGGAVGNDYIEASDLLTLDQGDVGILFCYPTPINLKIPISNNTLYDVYSSKQGFLKYNLSANTAFAPFVTYNDIEGKLYKLISQKTGNNIRVINSSFKLLALKKKDAAAKTNATAIITSFSPATVNAGALNDPATNVLTINGSGFGTPGSGQQIVFKDANNTTTTADYALPSTSPYITSWSDNQIVVKVPTRAGTGKFGVVTAPPDTGFAPSPLQVFYAVLNASFSSNIIKEPRLMNANGLGGYTIVYSTNTAGKGTDITADSAFDSFKRALKTWKEVVGANLTEGGTTTNQVVDGNDNINTIMFDNTNTGNPPVPSGTLAITYSSYTLCSSTSSSQKTGFDMVIRKEGVSATPASLPLNKSYCSLLINTLDLENTLLHELGHALNLAHIYDPAEQTSGYTTRNPAKLMHPTITTSIGRRALDQSAYAAGLYTVSHQNNTDYGNCRYTAEMVPTSVMVSPFDECPASFPVASLIPGTTVSIDLDHTTSNKDRDPQFTAIGTTATTQGAGVNVTNNAYYPIKTNGNGDLSFTITNYATYPVEAQANCPEQGARISVYQVNTCPAGQAFPAPVYATSFTKNTSGIITGLTANTTYLFYFDGLYSTKPSFDITFNGGMALPLLVTNFYGKANGGINNLSIELQSAADDIKKMILERGTDGLTFQSLAFFELLPQTGGNYNNNYIDRSPINGSNYYRVKMIHRDGSTGYSKIVLLKNNLAGQIVMYPNPVKDHLTIDLSYLLPDKYTVDITDAVGRKVYRQQCGATVVTVPFSGMLNGTYFVRVINSRNNVIARNKISR